MEINFCTYAFFLFALRFRNALRVLSNSSTTARAATAEGKSAIQIGLNKIAIWLSDTCVICKCSITTNSLIYYAIPFDSPSLSCVYLSMIFPARTKLFRKHFLLLLFSLCCFLSRLWCSSSNQPSEKLIFQTAHSQFIANCLRLCSLCTPNPFAGVPLCKTTFLQHHLYGALTEWSEKKNKIAKIPKQIDTFISTLANYAHQ